MVFRRSSSRGGRFLACAFVLALLAGCSTAPRRPSLKPVPAKVVLREAKHLLGVPYKRGGMNPRTGFDCSGLVCYIYKKHGSKLPRNVRGLWALGEEVAKRDLEPGDLVFFDTEGPAPGHVGIYAGGGRFIHAPSSGGRVREDELSNNYWRRAWYGARRLR